MITINDMINATIGILALAAGVYVVYVIIKLFWGMIF